MSSFLLYLEQKLGRFAFPGLVRLIVSVQALVWVFTRLYPNSGWIMEMLPFDPFSVLHLHQWWRCVTFLFMPTGSSLLWLLMNVPFFWMISDGLEEAWGSFRVNLYVLASVVCVVAAGLLLDSPVTSSIYILTSLMMAFAVHYPDLQINLYGIIPIKMKWWAVIGAGIVFFMVLHEDGQRGTIAAAMIPFVVVYGRGFRQGVGRQLQTMERRRRFAAASGPEDAALHRCAICGKTDGDHPQLDFRVNAEGEDVCSDCRAAAKAASGPA